MLSADDGPRFCVLGPVGVVVGEHPVALGGPGLRALLAILLLEPNQSVPVERIVDLLWDHEPPATARTIVQGYVSRLRKWLSEVDTSGATWIETSGSGYQLVVDEMRVDVAIARYLLAESRGQEPEVRASLLSRAQALWRGPELSDIGGRVRAPELGELRLAVIEARIDADLELGRHDHVIGELAALVDTHPFREHLVGQLVLALYRCGRRAAALEIYQRFAHRAAGELGLDPGPGLRELHSRVLRDDTALLRARPESMLTPRIGVLTPAQLPAPPSGFTGREGELAWLDGVRGEGIAVLAGPAGIGKSALALLWGSQVAREFTHGQLYVSLRGFDPRHPPVAPADVLARFLLALGVAAHDIPADLADRAGLYRSLLADRKVLVLLDDARDSDQVRPLLPGAGRSLVLVTSRRRLDGLVTQGARLRVLHTLAADAAVRLIEHAAGPPIDADDRAYRARLARLCGYLPLALRIAGARLAVSPQWSVGDLVAEMSDERTRLGALDLEDADTSVRAAFDVTHRALDPAHADTLRALGSFPGQWVSPYAVAALCGTGVMAARARLRVLAGTFLVTVLDRDMYGMHDLVRLYARELAGDGSDPLRAVLRHYLLVADLCRRQLRSVDDDIDPPRDLPAPDIADRDSALDWFEREWPNLLAVLAAGADAGLHAEVWRLARVAGDFRRVRSRRDDWEWLLDLGLTSARAAGEPRGEVLLRLTRCVLLTRFGAENETVADATTAVELAGKVGDPKLSAMALNTLASAWYGQKRYLAALDGYQRALVATRSAGYRLGEANLRNNIAQVYLNLGRPGEAVEPQTLAVKLYREIGDLGFVGLALANLAEIEHELGEFTEAAVHAREAVSLAEVNGLALTEAFGREVLARVLRDTGDIAGARAELTVAVTRYRMAQSPAVDAALAALASLPPVV
ncbi:MAG TPA: BTAD domain-containing putative transcriptional regulator [Actinokineospora sp.]|nr:BTAD domain-containing putative transcriptional regulator [Actinokineospora sp.]